jgi:hypothetical protein
MRRKRSPSLLVPKAAPRWLVLELSRVRKSSCRQHAIWDDPELSNAKLLLSVLHLANSNCGMEHRRRARCLPVLRIDKAILGQTNHVS